jgi:hypothetical protein
LRLVPVLLGLVRFGSGLGWVWFRISKNIWLWFGSGFCDNLSVWFCFVPTEPENRLSKILQLFSEDFFSNFLKNMKIQYKNTFNETKIRISQNLMLKNNNNIISRQFENILYFEIFKCLVLGLVRFGSQNSELVATLFRNRPGHSGTVVHRKRA